jgi:hypothetical protein
VACPSMFWRHLNRSCGGRTFLDAELLLFSFVEGPWHRDALTSLKAALGATHVALPGILQGGGAAVELLTPRRPVTLH